MSFTKLYDCLILGGGPERLSVVQGLARVHRTCALFSDSKLHPAEFRKLAREQISSYHNADFVDTKITKAVNTTRKARTGFEGVDSKGQK
jgi:hypothetical protein